MTSSHKREPLRKQLVLDVQWSNCPIEVVDEVKDIWKNNCYGNDNFIHKYKIKSHDQYHHLNRYLSKKGVGDDEVVWIHWWW